MKRRISLLCGVVAVLLVAFLAPLVRAWEREPLNVFAAATRELLRTFLVSLERGETPPCNAADNRHTLALMLGAYESDAKRMPISMG